MRKKENKIEDKESTPEHKDLSFKHKHHLGITWDGRKKKKMKGRGDEDDDSTRVKGGELQNEGLITLRVIL